ncbi:DUF4868 domain-containing protein [Bartonella sp. HY406]|uniref:DUF4868 domain-containing protein n=1 Tax=Bartonella sp. HY406 TaxID=2979331 RepID=UPI0021C59772|nr:DUF4868 domain-containing protein [Bartonella sp. HY406]UXN05113.1 DUF4868 domain-containing protein [Bartonella sp. HY406]
MTLFAYCKTIQGISIKRIPLDNQADQKVSSTFAQQETKFRKGRDVEVAFDGNWKPDSNELITLPATTEVVNLINEVKNNPLSIQQTDLKNFNNEGIKALFVYDGSSKLLIQRFTSKQILHNKNAFSLSKNSFTEVKAPVFSLDSSIACIVEDNLIKFISYSNLRMIFDLLDFFQAATNNDIDSFANHPSLFISKLDELKQDANQTIRKLIHKVMNDNVLQNCKPNKIVKKAKALKLTLDLTNGQVVVPQDKKLLEQFLRLLDDGLYEAALSKKRYMTNSKKGV